MTPIGGLADYFLAVDPLSGIRGEDCEGTSCSYTISEARVDAYMLNLVVS